MNASLKRQALFLLLIIQVIFPLTSSSNVETFEFVKEKTLSIDNNGKYLVLSIEGNNPSIDYVISAYSDDKYSNRIQLAQSQIGKATLVVSPDDYDDKTYIQIDCSETCSGSGKYEFSEKIELIDSEPINYYVNKNKKIDFTFKFQGIAANVWARGQFEIKSYFDDNSLNKNKKRIDNYFDSYIVKKDEYDDDNEYNFSVEAKQGDFINVGFVSYTREINNNYYSKDNFKNDGPVLTGFLKKNILESICYNLDFPKNVDDNSAIATGIIFTKIAKTYTYSINEDSGEEMEDSSPNDISSGFIKNYVSDPITKYCISFPDESQYNYEKVEDIVFTFHIEYLKEKVYIPKEPQLNGILYPRAIKRNAKVAFISYKDKSIEKMYLNLNSLRGFPKMYVYECENYPLCFFQDSELQKAIRPRNINRFSSYNVVKKNGFDESPISKRQTLFVVQCMKAENNDDKNVQYMDSLCDFNSLIYKKDSSIELIEEKFFNQYALIDEEYNYKIKLGKETDIQKVFIDIMTYVGDVKINIDQITKGLGIDADIYDSVNKIFISVKTNGAPLEELNFSIKGLNNTYYTILVTFATSKNDVDSFITNELQSGMPYLVTVDNEKTSEFSSANKIIKFQNNRVLDALPYMVNFYSLNCEIDVVGVNDEDEEIKLEKFEHFSHDLVTPEDEDRYINQKYEYRIKVENPDPSEYEQNLCKIFASSIELSNNHDDYTRDILIPDNIIQQVMYNKKNSKHLSFGYVHVDFKNDLLIKFNLKHTAKYIVQLYYENKERDKEAVTIVADNMLYIHSDEWTEICKDNSRVCYIQLDITLEETKDYESPVLELSIKSMGSHFVDYIPKNHLKLDYVQNNIPQYYYTEIGQNEEGFIIANFMRGSGKVMARLVKKDSKEAEKGANWREKYKLPDEDDLNDLLTMQPFTEKLSFSTGYECLNGCYLLISVISDVISKTINLPSGRNYPYSIIVQSCSSNAASIPSVRIPIDEYIVGSIEAKASTLITQYYSVWLNADAKNVVIDWQSDGGRAYINVGEKKSGTSTEFTIDNLGKDRIYKLSRKDILEKVPSANSLQGIVLTIAVWTNLVDSIFTTPFSFAVHLENEETDEIYRVNSDQKVLCKAHEINGNYRCVYVIDYDFITEKTGLLIYPNLQDKSASFKMYANFIDADDYELGTEETIKKLIPNKDNFKYSSEEQKKDYLFIKEGTQIDKYVLVSVEVSKETVIELISTIYLYQDEITPKPSSTQLFTTYENYKNILNYPNDYMKMINIIGVGGSGEVFWENEKNKKYYLKGRDDRLSITSPKSGNEQKMTVKRVDGTSEDFVFAIDYNIRNDNSNFDSLNLDKSVTYIYTNSDFPLVLYCPLTTFNMEKENNDDYYDISFSFYDLETEKEKELTYYESFSFQALGFIVKESMVYTSKSFPEMTPQINDETIFGLYDPAVRTGIIRIDASSLNSSKVTQDEKPYLFLKFDKSEEFKDIRKYKSISLETSVFHKTALVPSSELSGHFGYLYYGQAEVVYTLRNDKSKKYMNLEFSCDNDNIEITLGNKKLDKKEIQYGKRYYSFETTSLNEIMNFKIKRSGDLSNLQFFYFKYTFSGENKIKYTIKKTKLEVKKKTKENSFNYTIKLTPVDNSDSLDTTYIVRLIEDEITPNNSFVSMKCGIQNVKEFYKRNYKDKSLTLEIFNSTIAANYIQVIVQIKEKENVEYLSYDIATKFKEKSNKGGIIAGIVVGAVLVVVIVVLIIVIFIFNNKNKDLLDKVNKVSFADNEQRGDDDLLLSKD